MSHMSYLASRSLRKAVATLASSRLRTPKTRPLTTTTPSSAQLRSHPSAATSTDSTRSHNTTADHSSSALRQRRPQHSESESLPTSPSSPSPGKKKRPLLRPYELSLRLIALCKQGDVNGAVTTLQSAPRNAQNVKVWNTIIKQCMSAKKYKLAYSVFTDMKRRGFMPNSRTYLTMMGGYATVDDWGPLTTQLGLVHSVYGQLKQHLERSRNFLIHGPGHEPGGATFLLYAIALYISILGKAGEYQKAFDVFHELDTGGPLAAHPKVYSSLLSLLAERLNGTDVDAEVIAQSVSEAKYIWRRHMRSLENEPQHVIEPRSIEAMIKLLSRGDPSDHEFMFDILSDFCGLPRPSDDRLPSRPSSPKEKVGLTSWMFSEIIDGCNTAGRPDMAMHYAQIAMDTRALHPILRAHHLHKLLRGHFCHSKAGSTYLSGSENVAAWVEFLIAKDPTRKSNETALRESTIVFALRFCSDYRDMHSALRIARAIIVNGSKEGPSSFSLPLEAWNILFRLAVIASQDEKRGCVELFSSYASSIPDAWWKLTSTDIERLAPMEMTDHILLALRVARVLESVLHHESAENEKPDAADLEAWSKIRERATALLQLTS